MTPKQWAEKFIYLMDFCDENSESHPTYPNVKRLKDSYRDKFRNITHSLAKEQNKWNAWEWTEFDLERQRLLNTKRYLQAVKDSRVAA